jgi:hypothetical protein
MNAYTSGPWKVAHAIQDDDAARYIWSATDRATGHRELIATIPYAEGDHINADARLIAAAPDLLAALQMVAGIWSHDQTANIDPESPLAKVRAAIAKATGGDA